MSKPANGISRSQYVLKLMLSGEPVTIEEFKADFVKRDCENLFYKLSYYILQTKYKGAIIRTHNNGRKVIAYQLLNVKQFDANGKYLLPAPKIVKAKKVKKELENANG